MAKTPEIDLREDYQKNYLINGAMEFSQRGTSFSSISDGTYSLDRFRYKKVGAAAHTVTQDTDVPTLAQAGFQFSNSMRLNLTTPDTSIAAGDFVRINQFIEGYNWAQLAGKTFTLSFWVKATLPGTYCVAFVNDGEDMSYVAEYSIDAAGVWEKKSVTVSPSPETGTWNYVNGRGLEVIWTLASGSTFQTTAGAWQSGLFYSTANQVNGIDTGASDFRITGAMITEGSEELPFRRAGRNYAEELMLCKRFFQILGTVSMVVFNTSGEYRGEHVFYPVQMRANPAVNQDDPSNRGAVLDGSNINVPEGNTRFVVNSDKIYMECDNLGQVAAFERADFLEISLDAEL